MSFSYYATKNIEGVFEELKTSENGLSEKEAVLRHKKYGLNETKTRGVDFFGVLSRQFKSPFFYLLFAAALVALLIGEKVDSIVILAFVATNVMISFLQEYRAERAVFLLKKFIPQKVKVIRNGKETVIERKFLVPGDIVLLMTGDMVPAELRVLKANNFLVDESVLTGESLPSSKTNEFLKQEPKEVFQAENILFAGTTVLLGTAQGIVVGTGKDTALGEITKLVSGTLRESIYEKNLLYFCKLILKIVVATIVFIYLLNLIINGTENLFEFSLFSVALIVSILPEALPAVVTFALSKGSLNMAKEKVVVKRLASIEDLGNIEILCVDKTGTLTQNKLSLEKIVSSDKEKMLLYGLFERHVNPFNTAIYERAGNDILRNVKKFQVISESSFDPFKMRSSCVVQGARGEKLLIVKGAPEVILKNSVKLSGKFDKKEVKEDTERDGQAGKRVLALAFKKLAKDVPVKDDDKGLTFLGYFVFEDPLKTTAKEAIELSRKLGVQIKIITGDSKEVAGFLAKKIGLINNPAEVISGQDLEKMTRDDFDEACEGNIVFARISPDLKYKIIKSLQKRFEVGFMGEGINDAPALKIANIGIAVAEASDIAREASDVIILQKDLRVIVNGIKNGRTIFSNINKYIKTALASNFGNFYSIAVISLFINFLPMLPVQILLGNLLSDFPLITIATDTVDVDELKKPKAYQLHMVLPLIISLALVSTVFDFIFFAIFFRQAPGVIQTLWYIESILTEIVLIYVIRTRGKFWQAKRPSFWLLFLTAIDAVFIIALPFLKIGQTWFHFVAVPIIPLLIVFVEVAAYFWTSELVKLVYFRYWRPKNLVSEKKLIYTK
jgi:Mg2+-importing ATPase